MSAITANADVVVRDPRDELFGHPKGVYVCFFTEMWERFSFYGMKALLLLYLLQAPPVRRQGRLDLLGAYGGLVYCLPVIGGLLADRYLGMRKAVIFGGLLLVPRPLRHGVRRPRGDASSAAWSRATKARCRSSTCRWR